MSVSLVRKALEISSGETGIPTKNNNNNKLSKTAKLKDKKKKKITLDAIQKRNLKYLKTLDSLKPKPKKVSSQAQVPVQQSKKKKNKKNSNEDPNKTAFTEEDFAKFEQEYFVS